LKKKSAAAFVLGSTAAALAGLAALLAWTSRDGVLPAVWVVGGFLAMALPGVAGGAWLAREHGRAGSSFVAVLQAGMLVRLALAAMVAMSAAHAGGPAMAASMAGLAAGFLPVMAFEMVWFARTEARA
jgi:hypothetical protein